MIILDGKKIAEIILLKIKKEIIKEKAKPNLAVILIGNDPASQLYVKIKERKCQEVGVNFKKYEFANSVSENKIINLIKKLNFDKSISGIIVQLPLPVHLDTNQIISAISPNKDVDGLHPENLGKLLIGQHTVIPPTPAGILELMKAYQINLKGKHIVIVGYGKLVGKPLAAMLATTQKDATVTICNKDTKNLPFYTRQADVLISAAGVPDLIKSGMVKKDVVVIDAGTTVIKTQNEKRKTKNKIHHSSFTRLESAFEPRRIINNSSVIGDVDFEKVKKIAGAITPPTGGIGPLTVAMLIKNLVNLSKRTKI